MLTLGMLLSCVFITNSGLGDERGAVDAPPQPDPDLYAVTCYICVNVSDNVVCNQFAIDRPCKPGETFCHTLHIMDAHGNSVLVNKKCTDDRECQRNRVGCVEIDAQTMCIACCDQNYCNVHVPANSSTAVYDDRITRMRMLAKNLFREREKALTTSVRQAKAASAAEALPWLALVPPLCHSLLLL